MIRRQYCEPLTLARVADLCGITPDYLGALFRSQLGATFHACLVRARMRAAARLLRKGVKAEAVAQLVGYRSRQNFHQQFVRSFDTTPASYRR